MGNRTSWKIYDHVLNYLLTNEAGATSEEDKYCITATTLRIELNKDSTNIIAVSKDGKKLASLLAPVMHNGNIMEIQDLELNLPIYIKYE